MQIQHMEIKIKFLQHILKVLKINFYQFSKNEIIQLQTSNKTKEIQVKIQELMVAFSEKILHHVEIPLSKNLVQLLLSPSLN